MIASRYTLGYSSTVTNQMSLLCLKNLSFSILLSYLFPYSVFFTQLCAFTKEFMNPYLCYLGSKFSYSSGAPDRKAYLSDHTWVYRFFTFEVFTYEERFTVSVVSADEFDIDCVPTLRKLTDIEKEGHAKSKSLSLYIKCGRRLKKIRDLSVRKERIIAEIV